MNTVIFEGGRDDGALGMSAVALAGEPSLRHARADRIRDRRRDRGVCRRTVGAVIGAGLGTWLGNRVHRAGDAPTQRRPLLRCDRQERIAGEKSTLLTERTC